jgi:hypothetical protein
MSRLCCEHQRAIAVDTDSVVTELSFLVTGGGGGGGSKIKVRPGRGHDDA